jgi:ribosomal protein S18 acetylase RimI-like enzyme
MMTYDDFGKPILQELAIDGLTLRHSSQAEEPFLFALFSEVKSEELAPLLLNPEQMAPLLDMQFRASRASASSQYPDALDTVICLANGTRVGRLLFDPQPHRWRIMDLGILAGHRNRAIGSKVIAACQLACGRRHIGLQLSVFFQNPARRLYERLGFRQIPGAPESRALIGPGSMDPSAAVFLEMEWKTEILREAESDSAKQVVEPWQIQRSID